MSHYVTWAATPIVDRHLHGKMKGFRIEHGDYILQVEFITIPQGPSWALARAAITLEVTTDIIEPWGPTALPPVPSMVKDVSDAISDAIQKELKSVVGEPKCTCSMNDLLTYGCRCERLKYERNQRRQK